MDRGSIGITGGARVYYHGDMANADGFGTVMAKLDHQLRITMDDGRTFWIPQAAFSPSYAGHGGTRFVTEAAYREWKAKQMALIWAAVEAAPADKAGDPPA